jgi:HAD superfamily hydrolase (TIGR01493 family)
MSHTSGWINVAVLFFILSAFTFLLQCSSLYISPRPSKVELNNSSAAIPCSSINVSALRVLTFDLFGALMLTESSLQLNIAALLPSLSAVDVEKFADMWGDAYASYFGKSFPPSLTHQPFLWVIRSSLVQILGSFGLSNAVSEGSATFNSLVSTWGNLQPRPGVTEVLSKLSKKYQLGLLSNGDTNTLQTALRVFPPSVNVSLILSSDYPVNCFKPCPAMYAQALDAVHNDKTKVLHIAGSAFDANGARTFGIYSGVLDSSALHTNPQPCFAFDDIEQLLSFFDV